MKTEEISEVFKLGADALHETQSPENGEWDEVRFEELKAQCIKKHASQGTKEDGWVIVDPDGAVLTDSFKASFGSCAMANSITVMEWKKKVEKGYKCVIAERTTKLIER